MASIPLTPEQEQQAQALAARIRQAADADILQLARLLVSKPEHETFGQTEFEVRDIVHHLAPPPCRPIWVKKKRLPRLQRRLPVLRPKRPVPRLRSRTPLSLLGEVRCCRAWYYCRSCGKGLYPWDEAVGLTAKRLTPAAEQVTSMAGTVCNSFAEASERVLGTLSGLHLCESTVQRTAEDAGARIGQWLAQGARWAKRGPGIGTATPTARPALTSASI